MYKCGDKRKQKTYLCGKIYGIFYIFYKQLDKMSFLSGDILHPECFNIEHIYGRYWH